MLVTLNIGDISDPLNAMYRADSQHSLAESDDVHVMEGGVTIRQTADTRKKTVGGSTPVKHKLG